MTDIEILEIIVCVMMVANAVGFGILFGKVNYLISEDEMWLEHWIRERENDAGIHH